MRARGDTVSAPRYKRVRRDLWRIVLKFIVSTFGAPPSIFYVVPKCPGSFAESQPKFCSSDGRLSKTELREWNDIVAQLRAEN